MTKIRLSRKAIADLDGIWDYTAQTWSEEQAVIYYRQIYGAIQGLNNLPVVKSNFFFSTFKKFSFQLISAVCIQHKVGHFCYSL